MSPQPRKPVPTSPVRRRASAGIRRPRVAGRPDRERSDIGRPEAPVETGETGETGVRADVPPADTWRPSSESETAALAIPTAGVDAEAAVVPPPPPGATRADGSVRVGTHAGERPAGARARRALRARRERDEPFGRSAESDGVPRPRRRPRDMLRVPAAPSTTRGTMILAGVTVLALALATLAGVSWWTMRHTPAAQNTALVDVAATTEVSQQLGDAVRTVYSYDYTRLDQNEAAAREVITPAFGQQFDTLFGEVRKLAPQQQAVVTATISQSAVESITGDRAVLLVFLDQRATRAANDQAGQQVAAAGRLTVTGQLVDGRWKIAGVTVA
jgi:Mce-associated membrane protein